MHYTRTFTDTRVTHLHVYYSPHVSTLTPTISHNMHNTLYITPVHSLTLLEEHVVLEVELLVCLGAVLQLVAQEPQELARDHLFDAAHQVRVLRLLARQGQRQVLRVHRALQESGSVVWCD